MEDLSRQQTILVALLVSFITSIATGIVTVSLVDQTPQSVTQTINRVVERTIETVVPSDSKASVGDSHIGLDNYGTADSTKDASSTRATYSTEEDKVIDSIARISPSIVKVYSVVSPDFSSFVSQGIEVIIDRETVIVVPKNTIYEGGVYKVVFSDNKETLLTLYARNDDTGTAFFKIEKDPKNKISENPAALARAPSLKIGQTIIAFSGEDRLSIDKGTLTGIVNSEKLQKVILGETDIKEKETLFILANTNGEVIGLHTKNSDTGFVSFISSESIQKTIQSLEKPAEKSTEKTIKEENKKQN